MARVLDTEWATYCRHRRRLLRRHHGEWVLIQGRKVHDVFPSESKALTAGYRLLGDREPFLVHRIVRPEEEVVHDLGIFSLGL